MQKFNSYFSAILFFIFFIFYPINNLLVTLTISPFSTLSIVAPFVAIGLLHMVLAYKDTLNLIIYKIPIFSIFAFLTILLIILESYIYQDATYVPTLHLNAYNAYWIIFCLGGMLFTFYFKYLFISIRDNIFLLITLSSLFLIVFVVFVTHFSLIDFISRTFLSEDSPINYQTLSDYIVLGSFLLIAKFFKRDLILLAISLIIFLELFLLGSRSAIFFYIASIFLLFVKEKRFVFLFLSISIVSILLAIFIDDIIKHYADDPRIMSMFGGHYLQDASLKEREEQFIHNLRFIKDSWLTGGIYSEYLVDGVGTYIHNYVAYLQNFGILPFIVVNILIVKIVYNLIIYNRDTFIFRFIFLSTIFTLLSMFLSRSYDATWVLLILAISEGYFYMLKEGELDEDSTN